MGSILLEEGALINSKEHVNRLQVVSTSVGGVPEVLPPDLIWIAEPNVQG